jgi:hypothetical protein
MGAWTLASVIPLTQCSPLFPFPTVQHQCVDLAAQHTHTSGLEERAHWILCSAEMCVTLVSSPASLGSLATASDPSIPPNTYSASSSTLFLHIPESWVISEKVSKNNLKKCQKITEKSAN